MTVPETRPPLIADRMTHIDCMRGVAALSVALHHFVDSSFRMTGAEGDLARGIEWVLYELVDPGRFGVLLFFIISGYCIANSILRPGPGPVTIFAINRMLRIYPNYWVSLAAAFAVFGNIFSADSYLVNITLMQKFLGQPDVMGVYWTLPVELTFYGLCVILFLLGVIGSTRRLKMVFLALFGYSVLAGLARGALQVDIPWAWPFFLSLMVGGAILRRLDDARTPKGKLVFWTTIAVLAGMLVISLSVFSDPDAYDISWYRSFVPAAMAVLTFLFMSYLWRPRMRALAYCGVISYSIYLFHSIVFELARQMAESGAMPIATAGPLVVVTALLAATILLSSLTYAAIERPAIDAGRWLARALRQRAERLGT